MKLFFILIFFIKCIDCYSQNSNCLVNVSFHGHAYNNTPVELYVGTEKILSSKFDHSTITGSAGIGLFFIPKSDSCYYVATSYRKTQHTFIPSFCLKMGERTATNILALKVIVDGISYIKNINISDGNFILIGYEYDEKSRKKLLHFVQGYKHFDND